MSSMELGSRKTLSRLTVLLAAATCTLTGCAALSPQVFSNRLSPTIETGKPAAQPGESAAPTVPQARADIESVQKKYARAIQDLSNITPRSSAALIGLSAAALYKALTGGSTAGIAALGVGGSAVWAYGSTMTSQPRQRVYAEGIRALSCALTASSPYDRDKTWTDTFDAEIDDASLSFEQLRDWQETYAYLGESETIPGRKAVVSPECPSTRSPPCAKGTSGSAADDQALLDCQAKLAKETRACTATGGTDKKMIPPPQRFTDAVERAKAEQTRLQVAVSNGRSLKGILDVAGQTLMDRSTDIQVGVSGEVQKTEPDPSAVLGTLKNLKQVAGLVAGTTLTAPTTAPPAGTGGAQGAALAEGPPQEQEALRNRDAEIDAALSDLRGRLNTSYAARVRLENSLAEVDGAVRKVNRTLDQCEFTAPGAVALIVSPSATTIQLPLGSTQSFTVSGGTGVPLGSVNAVAGAKLGDFPEPRLDRGTFNFSYKAPADGHVGDQVIVLFTDAAHQGSHEVTITAVAATTTTDTRPPPDGNQQPRGDDVPPPAPKK